MRVSHCKFGSGIILEQFVSGGGQPVARLIFDNSSDQERTMLRSCLSESREPLPEAAKTPKKKRTPKKPKPEVVPDELLVASCDETVTGMFDHGLGQEPTESTENACFIEQ